MRILYIILISQFLTLTMFAQEPLRKVTLQLSWLNQFQFAGYYMAKEKGFFKEVGLDVQIKEINNEVDFVNDITTQKSNYAVGRSSLIIDKVNGAKIVLLSAIFQHSPLVLITLKNSGINRVKDLQQRNIMLTPDARSTVSIHAMASSSGIDLKTINFQPHSYNLDDLINGETDAMGCYLSNEPYTLNAKNIAYSVLNPRDYGFDFYGDILFTSEQELLKHPNDVHNFKQAVLKGWNYAFTNIGETVNLIFNKYNTQKKTLDSLIYEAYVLKDLAEFDKNNLGKISIDKIKEIAKIYAVLGFTQNGHDLLDNFIYQQNLLIFNNQEKAFIVSNNIKLLTDNNEPFYIYKDDFTAGISSDLFNFISEKASLSTTFETIKNTKNVKDQLKNSASIKLVTTSEDLERKNTLYTNPIKKYKYAIATRNDETFISSLSELNGKKVLIPKTSLILKEIKQKYPLITFIEVHDSTMALENLSEGKGYAAIDILPHLTYLIRKSMLSNVKISGTTDFLFELKYMLDNQYKELLAIMNKTITQLKESDITQIENTYFHVQYDTSIDYSFLYKMGAGFLFFIAISSFYTYKLRSEIKKRKLMEQKLYNAATVDSLTQIYNRRRLDSLFKKELAASKRYHRPLSIIFFDIDNFKKLNDVLGHNVADTVLVNLASLVQNNIRDTDSFGRWGGEEFLVLLPEIHLEQAIIVANHLREKIENNDFNVSATITCSFGVTEYTNEDSENSMLTRVDNLMYDVKANGKNAVKAG